MKPKTATIAYPFDSLEVIPEADYKPIFSVIVKTAPAIGFHILSMWILSTDNDRTIQRMAKNGELLSLMKAYRMQMSNAQMTLARNPHLTVAEIAEIEGIPTTLSGETSQFQMN